jgi:transcriptional regulator with XRE-family HTH domain
MEEFMDFGSLISKLRIQHNLPQKLVADKLGIDVSMLSKIEHGERQIQQRMLPILSNIFNLDFKELQIKYLTTQIEAKFGEEPYFFSALNQIVNSKKTKLNANFK